MRLQFCLSKARPYHFYLAKKLIEFALKDENYYWQGLFRERKYIECKYMSF